MFYTCLYLVANLLSYETIRGQSTFHLSKRVVELLLLRRLAQVYCSEGTVVETINRISILNGSPVTREKTDPGQRSRWVYGEDCT
ncbi:hypothetical protein ASPZODRAFT_908080 [Penicilliopsis zonata CBS 506.65]|uniref:Uncharacterized protein n=1 Tax=Penicilliopsis zonata CBS 506.65 TaxID=1073090 RepID=A0A1L9S921_9EURO|nr:hypothetical protein ASPZODRAFT_908080 [Penicilliopsis zonata CBS 506.65]OJJ43657.1 hypothetical protein ASPZODRAFT_908080 [Penicilliopsis zonata CBS 506.65]